jgi:tyrosine-protein phosphatase SIW14
LFGYFELTDYSRTLVSEPYPEENARFLKENGITHYQIGMPGNKESCITPVPDEKITAALSVVLDRRNHPILIHCNKGKVDITNRLI